MPDVSIVFSIPEEQTGPYVQHNLEFMVLAALSHCASPEGWPRFRRWMSSYPDSVTAQSFVSMGCDGLIALAGRMIMDGRLVLEQADEWPTGEGRI